MKEKIELIVNKELEGSQLFLAEVLVQGNRIEVLADGDVGININECARINHALHMSLEAQGVDTGKLTIDVSSPGIEQPIEGLRNFKKNIGRKVQIRNHQNKILKGWLVSCDAKGIALKTGNTLKTKIEKIAYPQLREALIVI
jgi:ribosome maturation factor RimP